MFHSKLKAPDLLAHLILNCRCIKKTGAHSLKGLFKDAEVVRTVSIIKVVSNNPISELE